MPKYGIIDAGLITSVTQV